MIPHVCTSCGRIMYTPAGSPTPVLCGTCIGTPVAMADGTWHEITVEATGKDGIRERLDLECKTTATDPAGAVREVKEALQKHRGLERVREIEANR